MTSQEDNSIVRECLRKQLEEYELLKSMYSNPGEFQSDTPYLAKEIEEFLNGSRENISDKLDYRIKLPLNSIQMELTVVLNKYYPLIERPMLIIRTDILSKQDEKTVKDAIEKYIDTEVDKSEPYIFQVISWLQENITDLVQIPENEEIENKDSKTEYKEKMARAWLWSHHIYSKIKRQDIIKLTKDYNLNGFMWPGKPGVICFEGIHDNVDDVVKIVKTWNWQKLKLVKLETSCEDPDDFHRFLDFQEIITDENDTDENSKLKQKKMDNSAFFKYLEKYQSGYMKKEMFGFE